MKTYEGSFSMGHKSQQFIGHCMYIHINKSDFEYIVHKLPNFGTKTQNSELNSEK